MNDRTSILTIPAGVPFARTLARSLLDRAQEQDHPLSETRILLPTRRACRVLQGAFLEENGGKPLLLPRLQTLGDVDEEDLSLSVLGAQGDDALLNLPPSMPPLRRQFLLARLISAVPDFQQDHDHALNLAGALGRFMDHI
ncbi:MAG: double-strand break repair protein AddB, partial [Alphaproteobacteria bacterium]|nr:double-strand break repair protein AddB [Alphaproteobacteria bacterium]